MKESIKQKITALDCWTKSKGSVDIHPLSGGITNQNFKVTDGNQQYVVRLGEDIYEHLITRTNEAAASRAAFEIGVSPEVVHVQPGVLVIRFIEGKVYSPEDIRQNHNLEKILNLIKRFHLEMPNRFSGYPMMFWVFQVLTHYRNVLERGQSAHLDKLPGLMGISARLEQDTGPVKIVYGHNDLLAANFIDDGDKLWMIDFDYAGFNSPLFDLANLASNNELAESQERWLLEHYFEDVLSPERWRSYQAMKCASLLRETMWSMVSEIHSDIDFDYSAYTAENLARFDQAYNDYRGEFGV